jgi:hypothetical protein
MPEPLDGEEVIVAPEQAAAQAPAPPGEPPAPAPDDEEDAEDDDEDEPPPAPDGTKGARQKAADAAAVDPDASREYTDRVERSAAAEAAKAIAPTIAALLSAVERAGSYAEARQLIVDAYRGAEAPRNLAQLTEAALLLAQAGGGLGVLEETPELLGGG